ncbi:MAG: glycosyltransferase family 39 protein [Formivibrio sp.]|nr:glycosyltransferase family 39 protein [Formivibrio sp.]
MSYLQRSSGPQNRTIVIYWIVLAFIWFFSLSTRALIHSDEGRYASIAMEMLQSGDWITPRLNGILYFEKPALQYWAGAASFALFGFNEFAARFWPGLTGFLTIVVVWLSTKKLWGATVGHLAALAVAGSAWIIGNSHFLTLDMGTTFFLTLSLCSFILAQDDATTPTHQRGLMWLCWAAMAGATLSKGLIGILIPGMTLILYSLINWHWAPWRRMHWLSGLTLFFALTAPWFYLVAERNPGFNHFFFIHEHFERFLTTEHRRAGPIWYFVPYLILGFLPWTTLLGQVCREGWKTTGESFRTRRFLLIWCVFIFAFFSKSGSKLPSYILPMFPALGILLALVLEKIPSASLKKHLLLPILAWVLVLCAYPFVGRFASVHTPLPILQHLALYLVIAGVVFLVCAALAWRALKNNRKITAVMLLVMATLLAVTLGGAGHDSYGQLKSSKWIVQDIAPYLQADTQVFSVRTYDQTFPYYLRRQVTLVDYVDEFEFGENAEPGRWIPTLADFVPHWNAAKSAVAMMDMTTYETLKQQNVPMKIIYQDVRRMVVAKP